MFVILSLEKQYSFLLWGDILFMYVFIYGLFYNTVGMPDYTVSQTLG